MRTLSAALVMLAAMPVAAASPQGMTYQSTTAAYIPYQEAPMVDWSMANDAMGPMHGSMGHMMAAPDSSSDEKGAGMPATRPASDDMGGMGGGGHGMGGQP